MEIIRALKKGINWNIAATSCQVEFVDDKGLIASCRQGIASAYALASY